jgi:hypothetical protein
MSHRLVVLTSILIGLLSACAPEPEAINRVQTNLVEKSIFQGEWWYTSTSIDVDFDQTFVFNTANAGAPFSGSMSTDYALDFNRGGPSVLGSPSYSFPIARIRWVIDERYLFAYRSFELVEGGNPDGRDESFRGEPLAVFAIEDHVDVRKDFSPVTGEESNVTLENNTDRKWFDRKLMRVDWSQNLLTKFTANDVQSNELFTAFRRESVPFFVQGGSHPDLPATYQPQFVRVRDDEDYARRAEWSEAEADTVHYMSFVTQEVWSPADGCLRTGGICASANATMRNSFLRVPDKHTYAAHTVSNQEFDRFGIFRSHQPTYAGGGRDKSVQRKHCVTDQDCTDGGACDTESRRASECTAAGKPADCRAAENICVGGLTSDLGQTDFLSFYSSRLNFFENSLTDKVCEESWECDGRYGDCASGDDACQIAQTSACDPAAKRCTVPLSQRTLRPVKLHLSPHFPPYLVRAAFEAVAEWNEVLMRGHRAAKGVLPFDQSSDGGRVTSVDLNDNARVACQRDNPAGFCFCDSPASVRGTCRRDYEAFESPEAASARGIPSPYDCYVQAPMDQQAPQNYSDYFGDDAYNYKFTGEECMLTLVANSCDVDSKEPCEDLGDLRYNFLTHLQHGGANFGGVAQPLSDPTNGELVTVSATMAAESIESVGTLASQFFPVLRGEASEDSFFAGENVRGYYSAMGKVERPVTSVPVTSEGNDIADNSRPRGTADADAASKPMASMVMTPAMQSRVAKVMQKAERLKGSDGRASILSDRMLKLKDSPLAAQLADALSTELPNTQSDAANAVAQTNQKPTTLDLDSAQKELELERKRKAAMAARNMDDFTEKLFNSQYFRYYAERFRDRPAAEASLRMQQAQFKAVTLHELGHTLGLRHNFAGSLDRNNYPDAYYTLATREPLPTFEEYDAPALGGNGDQNVDGEEAQRFGRDMRDLRERRLQAGAGTVMSASIMDYNGDLSDFSGLGRYDRAAVYFEYFDKVEAYQTPNPTASPDAPADGSGPLSLQGMERPDLHRRELWTYYRGGESCQSSQDCPFSAGRESTIYQPLTQRCVANPRLSPGGRAECSKTGACVCSNFYDDFDNYAAGGTSRPEYAPVKYLYCHDNRVSDLSWCTRSDAGESYSEVVEHYRRGWRERYPRQYFRQYSASGPQKGASYGDVVEAVKIYQHMFFRLSYEGAAYQNNPLPLGFSDQLKASAAAFDWLTEIIGAPDVGSYQLDTSGKQDVYRLVSHTLDAGDVQLPVGQGLYLWSEYQTGLNGFFRLERAGTFLDKILAIQALTKRDWGFQYQVDEFFYVNFYDFFEQEIVDLFGGLISRNPRQYAPRYNADADGQLEYISAFRNFGTRTTNQDVTYPAPAIDGADSETLRDFATISALSEFPVFYDTSFEQRLLVFKLGSGDGYKIPETRRDGTPTCQYLAEGCTSPDYIVYESDRLHTSYVAVTIDAGETNIEDEQQVAFQLLRRLTDRQTNIRSLTENQSRSQAQNEELERLTQSLQRDESFLEYLIELERQLGISSYFF